MGDTFNNSKKQKLDQPPLEKKEEWPPQYGEKDYWEQRYENHRRVQTGEEPTEEETDVLPYHEWYFTYEDLAPLILPIILGCNAESAEDSPEKCNSSATENDDDRGHSGERESAGVQGEDEKGLVADVSEIAVDGGTARSDNESDDKVDEEVYDDDDDDEQDVVEREGLAINGPISVLEIGCGDMPLGKGLALELSRMENATGGAKTGNIVKKIVCSDYSSAVIDVCKEDQQAELTDGNRFVEAYVTMDARNMPYPDSSFHLVLEKGTLDAMLSDEVSGASNCTLIVTESARVLKEGGYILLVSHLNAHSPDGIDWLNTVVVPGLRAGGGKGSKWEVEVHGNANDELSSQDEESDMDANQQKENEFAVEGGTETLESGAPDDGDMRQPSGGPSPAVYIIHKLSKVRVSLDDSDEDPPVVLLRFFGY